MSSRNLRPVERQVQVLVKIDLAKSPFKNLGFLHAFVGVKSTWKQFLISKCNISLEEINEHVPLYVCSSDFTWKRNLPNPRRAWKATLDQQIEDFLSNYKNNLSIIVVKLMTGPFARRSPLNSPPDLAGSVYRTTPPTEMASNSQSTVTSSGSDGSPVHQRLRSASAFQNPTNLQAPRNLHLERIVTTTGERNSSNREARNLSEISLASSGQRGINGRQGRHSADRNATNVSGPINRGPIINLEPMGAAGGRDTNERADDSENEDDSDGDRWSEGTAAVEEEAELRRGGIQMQNLKPVAIAALNRVDNTILLKARKEIQKLRRDGLWFKNVKRAPFCAFLVEELLRPQQDA